MRKDIEDFIMSELNAKVSENGHRFDIQIKTNLSFSILPFINSFEQNFILVNYLQKLKADTIKYIDSKIEKLNRLN